MTSTQWILMDNISCGYPASSNMAWSEYQLVMQWARENGLVNSAHMLTTKGKAWWAEHKHEKPEATK